MSLRPVFSDCGSYIYIYIFGLYIYNVKLDITTKLFYFWLTGFMLNTIFKALLNVSVLFSVQLRCNVA